ncbi:MAG: methyl-accepting chemotaxis protein [Geobacter sp.]|nr:methyl-accepting chemotaxis protein [Geobacter sp.]
MKIRNKLLVLIVMSSLTLIATGILGIVNMGRINSGLGEANANMQKVSLMDEMKSDFLGMRLDIVYLMALRDRNLVAERIGKFDEKVASVQEKLKKIEQVEHTAEEKAWIKEFQDGFAAYAANSATMKTLAQQASLTGAEKQYADLREYAQKKLAPLYAAPAEAISRVVQFNIKESEQEYLNDTRMYHRIVTFTGILIAFCVLAAIGMGILIMTSITRPLAKVSAVVARVAAGDLTVATEVESRDEMGGLAKDVDSMVTNLREIVYSLDASSTQVASAATELFAIADQMATGTNEVAAQATTVATAGEEMAATSTQIASNCCASADNANEVSASAQRSVGIIHETIEGMTRIANKVSETAKTMGKLGERSDQIGVIVGTIEDIADQTNLLALNAAIEAARAGEQGRGFAVVADEVRALAERTTKATREIGEMIHAIQKEVKDIVVAMEDGVTEVESGTRNAGRSGEALQAILEQVSAVTEQISQIATAAEQQTSTTAEIANNIMQITQGIEQTSQGTQDASAAANELSTLAEAPKGIVGRFQVEGKAMAV